MGGAPRSLLQRLRPPRRLRATREGKAFVALTVATGVAAMNTGNNLLYLALAINLSLVILSGFLSEGALRGVTGEVRRAADLFAGTEGRLAVLLDCGSKRRSSRSLSVRIRAGGGITFDVPFPDVPAGGRSTRIASFVPPRRGILKPEGAALFTSYPFGLFEKSLELPPVPPLVVYPRPSPYLAAQEREPERAGERGGAVRGPDGAGIAGVREHLPGDALRDVHWKASARLGRRMVKERERDREGRLEIRIAVPADEEELERELSRACGAVLACARDGRPFTLSAGDASVADDGVGARRDEALTILARLRADGSLDEPPDGSRSGSRPPAPVRTRAGEAGA